MPPFSQTRCRRPAELIVQLTVYVALLLLYHRQADVFSFGVVLWELLTCKIPYSDMTPLQAAVGVVQKGLRPAIPPNCLPQLASMMSACWDASPMHRCGLGLYAFYKHCTVWHMCAVPVLSWPP
jgi:serine/threonine protein kinase